MTELTETGSREVATPQHQLGIASELTSSDIQIGRLAVAQAMSEAVKNEQVKIGDIYNASTLEVYGNKDKAPVEFFPILLKKYWVHKQGDDFMGVTPGVYPNEMPWEDGTKRNLFTYSYFVLLANDIADEVSMPLQLALQSTGTRAAKQLNAFAIKLDRLKMPSWGHAFDLTAVEGSKDKYKWWAPNVKLGRKASEQEMATCEEWFHQLSAQEAAVTESIAEAEKKAASESQFVSDNTDF